MPKLDKINSGQGADGAQHFVLTPAVAGTMICVLPPSCRHTGPVWPGAPLPAPCSARAALHPAGNRECILHGGMMEERGKDANPSPPSSYEVHEDEGERGMDSPFSFPWEINSWSWELRTPGWEVSCTWLVPSLRPIVEWALELQFQCVQLETQSKKGNQVTRYK